MKRKIIEAIIRCLLTGICITIYLVVSFAFLANAFGVKLGALLG